VHRKRVLRVIGERGLLVRSGRPAGSREGNWTLTKGCPEASVPARGLLGSFLPRPYQTQFAAAR